MNFITSAVLLSHRSQNFLSKSLCLVDKCICRFSRFAFGVHHLSFKNFKTSIFEKVLLFITLQCASVTCHRNPECYTKKCI